MFQSIPAALLETDRLVFRQPAFADVPGLVEAVQESLAELRPWMPWAQGDYTPADAESFTRHALDEARNDETMNWRLIRKADNLVLGSVGLHDVHWDIPRFEIGYWLRSSAVGNGYMTEAVTHLTRLCRDHFQARRMTIRCDAENDRSRKVAERAGYTFESRTVNHRRGLLDNRLHDMLTFAITWPD